MPNMSVNWMAPRYRDWPEKPTSQTIVVQTITRATNRIVDGDWAVGRYWRESVSFCRLIYAIKSFTALVRNAVPSVLLLAKHGSKITFYSSFDADRR
jgi:hypothetical protein